MFSPLKRCINKLTLGVYILLPIQFIGLRKLERVLFKNIFLQAKMKKNAKTVQQVEC